MEIPYDKFNSVGVTWYTLSKAYSKVVYIEIRNQLTCNSSATEQKAVLWLSTIIDYAKILRLFINTYKATGRAYPIYPYKSKNECSEFLTTEEYAI